MIPRAPSRLVPVFDEEAVMVNNEQNSNLRRWAIAAATLVGVVFALPTSVLKVLVTDPDTNILIRAVIAGILIVVILGFYLRMFFECAFSTDVRRRGAWLLLFVVIPIFSAFVYFFVTRSKWYLGQTHR